MSFGLSAAAIGAIGAGVGAATGAVKAGMGADKANRDRSLAAATQRYSPWTGLKANEVKEADPFGDVLSGAAGGAGLGQSIAAAVPGSPAAPALNKSAITTSDLANKYKNQDLSALGMA